MRSGPGPWRGPSVWACSGTQGRHCTSPPHTHTAEEGQSLGVLDQEEAWTKQGRKERRLLGQPQEALGLSTALQLGDNFLDAELPDETFGPQNELSFLVGSHKVP